MAKKQKPQGRLRYEKETDRFFIEIWCDDEDYTGWSLVRSQKCMRYEGQPEDEDAEMVHFTMLKELAQMAEWGYDIHIAR